MWLRFLSVCLVIGISTDFSRAQVTKSEVDTRLNAIRIATTSPNGEKSLVDFLREDPSPHVRQAAARALGQRPMTKLALAALSEVVADPDEVFGVRGVAAYSLGRIGTGSGRVKKILLKLADETAHTETALQALIAIGATAEAKAFLTHADPQIRKIASQALANTAGGDGFLAALTSSDPEVVKMTLTRATNRGIPPNHWTKEEIAAVQKLAMGTDPTYTALAVTALVPLRQTGPLAPFLVDCLSSNDALLRNAGVRGLAVAGPAVVPLLPKIVAAIDTVQSPKLILAIGEAGAEAKPGLPKLYSLLTSQDVEVRRTAITALIKAGAADPKGATAKVKALSRDPDAEVRRLVEEFLTQVPGDTTELAASLANKDLRVAIRTLPTVAKLGADAATLAPDLLALAGRIPVLQKGGIIDAVAASSHEISVTLAELGPKAVPTVTKGLSASDVRVRRVAARALFLSRLDAVGSIEELRKALADNDAEVRHNAGMALGNMGYRSRIAVPELITGLTTKPDSAPSAAVALAQIGATGDEAKKLLELARDVSPAGRNERLYAAGGAGPEALPILVEVEKSLPKNDRMLYAINIAKGLCDRDQALRTHLAALKDLATSKTPHETVWLVLYFDLTAEQNRTTGDAIAAALGGHPPHLQAELLRCLGWLGPDAASALAEVEKLQSSPDARVKGIARRTAALLKP